MRLVFTHSLMPSVPYVVILMIYCCLHSTWCILYYYYYSHLFACQITVIWWYYKWCLDTNAPEEPKGEAVEEVPPDGINHEWRANNIVHALEGLHYPFWTHYITFLRLRSVNWSMDIPLAINLVRNYFVILWNVMHFRYLLPLCFIYVVISHHLRRL